MRYDRTDASFIKISELICPECGGKLLRGPRAGYHNHNLTCRDCKTKINAVVVFHAPAPLAQAKNPALRGEAPQPAVAGERVSPRSDNDFIARAVVLGWEVIGPDPAGAAFYDPAYQKLVCAMCDQVFTGPGVYCCAACAIDDA